MTPRIAVFHGGVSVEREVSLGSGEAAIAALAKHFEVDAFDVQECAIPADVSADRHVVFSTLHGAFGEDGQIQKLLDDAGIAYAGCDALSSRLTFDKAQSKAVFREQGIPVSDEIVFDGHSKPTAEAIVERLGSDVVIKPRRGGSSIGLYFGNGLSAIARILRELPDSDWMVEKRLIGRELTIGILEGEPLEIVEIHPKSGAFDYESKYTKGLTEFSAPADLDTAIARRVKEYACRAFAACGCRDFARIDFILTENATPHILETNTLPGLKETSLLPMSASVLEINFESLLLKLVEPAISRYKAGLTSIS